MSGSPDPGGARDAGQRQRIIEAAYECVRRWGIAKTTVEDAARQAGVSRATVYRYFPGGRDELVGAVVSWEKLRFFARLYEEVHDSESLEEVMERGIVFARQALVEHEVLQRVLQTEPGLLITKLTVDAGLVVDLVSGFLAPYLERHGLAEGVDVGEASDFLARMILSYIASPGRYDLTDEDQVRDLVRGELLAGIVAP